MFLRPKLDVQLVKTAVFRAVVQKVKRLRPEAARFLAFVFWVRKKWAKHLLIDNIILQRCLIFVILRINFVDIYIFLLEFSRYMFLLVRQKSILFVWKCHYYLKTFNLEMVNMNTVGKESLLWITTCLQ